MRAPEKLKPEEQAQLAFLRQVHPSLEFAYNLVQGFLEMVRKREGRFEAWLEQIRKSQIPELIRFANEISETKLLSRRRSRSSCSNGVVEGHVHR